MSFAPVPLPRSGLTREQFIEDLAQWVGSPPIRSLVAAFGGTWPAGDLREVLTRIDNFSAEHWDFRNNRERNLAERPDLSPDRAGLILDAADALGMVHEVPPLHEEYDHVLILGGLVRACVLRPQFAARLLQTSCRASSITALGGFRPLGGDEPELAAAGGLIGVGDEFEAMGAGMAIAFGLSGEDNGSGEVLVERGESEQPNLRWEVQTFDRPKRGSEPEVRVIAAPSTDASRRANTADTYEFWATSVAQLQPGVRILVVTSAIYRPYQHIDAIRILGLPFGAAIDTVGVDTGAVADTRFAQTFHPSAYLQEIRSALRAAVTVEATLRP